ncbi:hypothetical protein WJX84_004113 [Apatococcus fuscideae]|uniref:Uncharacterized protein n=1 Tax=Apatococcus fuscideae TaxID=2026836 RepID=A0AAW1SXZ3_9CHLO
MEQLTTLQAAQSITNRQGSQSRVSFQPPTSPTDEGVDTVWIYGSDTFRRIVPGCRILFYSSHGGWQIGLVWQVKPDRHADPRRKRPLTWRVLADKIPQTGMPDVHQLNTGKVHWRLLQPPDATALDFFGITSFEDIIDGKYENILLESSLGIGSREQGRSTIPPIYTETVQEEIHQVRDLQYLLALPGCLPPHKRGELGATYAELVQAIQGDYPAQPQSMQLASPAMAGRDFASASLAQRRQVPQILGTRPGGLTYQSASGSGRQSVQSDELELPAGRDQRRSAQIGSQRELFAKSIEELNSTFKSRVDELYFSDARDQFWDAIIVEYAASSAALKEQYSEIAEAFL